MNFARTKIQPPRPREGSLIERPQLEQRLLAELRQRRLVLLCAAAGFGKTSALARVLGRLGQDSAVAWVSCDENDTPVELFSCLLAALEPFDLPWRSAPEALARAASEATTPALRRRIAAEVINALDGAEVAHGVIVVDDLHRIDSPAVFDFLDALLERLSPRWTLVLLTRREPPLALPRLRALGELAEFGIDDLRLQRDEARAVAAGAGVGAELADRLLERTQGWAAGLRLALNAPRGGHGGLGPLAAAPLDRPLFEFLAAEVIDRLEPELRDFLVAVSVLPELTAARCSALSGQPQAAERLEEIERRGLFASRLDAAEPTLRLHDLFREALEARFARCPPEQRARVLAAAADTEPDPLLRMHWLARTERWDEAERLIAVQGEQLALRGLARAVAEAVMRLPAARRESSPALQLLLGQLAWGRWDWSAALDATARASELYEAAGQADAARNARSYRCIALLAAMDPGARDYVQRQLADPALAGAVRARTLWAAAMCATRGDQREVGPALEQMLQVLAGVREPMRWYECCPIPPMVGLPGTRRPLQQVLAGVRPLLPEQPTPLRGMCHTVQGWLHLAGGDIAAAEVEAAAALAESRWLAHPVNVESYGRGLLAVLQALRGRAHESRATLETLVSGFDTGGDPLRSEIYVGLYLYVGLRCAAIGDDLATLRTLLARLDARPPGARHWMSAGQLTNLRGYAALAGGDLEEACATWRQILVHEHEADLYGQMAETRLRLADALLRRQRPPAEAAAVLAPLSDRLAGSGEWGLALMAGPATLGRLAQADWQGTMAPAPLQSLRQWAEASRALAAGAATAGPAAIPSSDGPAAASDGPLSAREWEVLACIAAGDSNKLIARALDLSPHTVKRHVANILDKLALSSRGQAAAWYRDTRP
ncbi:MAG: LuxR C-terminal-related transcriptional regulator [Rubrivivax sp.]